ncbi:MAG: hypothetical protein R2711_18360 [Acidimicrobiales bacterium]
MGSSADDALRSLVGSVRRAGMRRSDADAPAGATAAGPRSSASPGRSPPPIAAAPTVVHLVGGRTTIVEVRRPPRPRRGPHRRGDGPPRAARRRSGGGPSDDVRDLTDRAACTAGVVGREQLAEVLSASPRSGWRCCWCDGSAVGGCSGRSAPTLVTSTAAAWVVALGAVAMVVLADPHQVRAQSSSPPLSPLPTTSG